jgi:hypothetical protein
MAGPELIELIWSVGLARTCADENRVQICNAISLLVERARALLNCADPRDLTLRLKQS